MNDSYKVFKLYLKFFKLYLKNIIRLLGLSKQPISLLPEGEIKFFFFFTFTSLFIKSLHMSYQVNLTDKVSAPEEI